MYLVRQESDVVVGIDTEFRPICQCLALTAITPDGPAAQAGLEGRRPRARARRAAASIGTSRSWICAATAASGQVVRLQVERDGVVARRRR